VWTRRIGDAPSDPYLAKTGQPLVDDGACRGLPLGGLGTGSIGRDFDGRLSRWHLTPGVYRHQVSPGSWVAVQWEGAAPAALAAPGVQTRPDGLGPLPGEGRYEALFPFAWYRFRDVTLRQWSPVVPGRERESAWPVAYFEVTLRNPERTAREAAVAVAFELPAGEVGGDGPIALSAAGTTASGRLEAGAGSFALGVEAAAGADTLAVPLRGGDDYGRLGGDLWAGAAELAVGGTSVRPGAPPGLAAVARARLEPGEERTFHFALAWDLPQVRFGEHREHRWWRAHTREFGRTGGAAPSIVDAALRARPELARAAEDWHRELEARLAAWRAPDWLLPALCNELSVLVEGGTVWVVDDDGREEHFGTLECLDYPFYETLDVRYYSSFVLLELWPRLERLVIRDLLQALDTEDPSTVLVQAQGRRAVRKVRHAAPHDLGGPGDDPFRRSNAYTLQDTTIWKDLNPKLVLQVVRDARLLADPDLAASGWRACRDAIAYLERFDHDRDGIPENGGVPDQTYDTWPMTGISAYCADLWLGCLGAAEWLAEQAGSPAEAARLARMRERAAASVERALWTGTHYRFDSSGGPRSETILADQLAGTWYSLLLGLPLPHPRERVERALATVIGSNLRGFAGGRLGPVNGRSPNGGPAPGRIEQADEVWAGVSWGLASLCLLLGRDTDAWELGEAVYRTVYEESGLWFRTPEAWTEERRFRAQTYHRALAVWSLYTALRLRSQP
jgi:non-lysosomal glucosylceramidase